MELLSYHLLPPRMHTDRQLEFGVEMGLEPGTTASGAGILRGSLTMRSAACLVSFHLEGTLLDAGNMLSQMSNRSLASLIDGFISLLKKFLNATLEPPVLKLAPCLRRIQKFTCRPLGFSLSCVVCGTHPL